MFKWNIVFKARYFVISPWKILESSHKDLIFFVVVFLEGVGGEAEGERGNLPQPAWSPIWG